MEFHEVPWDSMRFHGVSVNRSVPTETNRGLTSYNFILEKDNDSDHGGGSKINNVTK
jgi:hypothetical protein